MSPDFSSLLVTSKNTSKDQGGLVQYAISEDGSLSNLGKQLKQGDIPCYVSITPVSKYALSTNYDDDEISPHSFSVNVLNNEIDHLVKADKSKGHYIETDPS